MTVRASILLLVGLLALGVTGAARPDARAQTRDAGSLQQAAPTPTTPPRAGAGVRTGPPPAQWRVALAIAVPLLALGGGAALAVTRFAAWYRRRWHGRADR